MKLLVSVFEVCNASQQLSPKEPEADGRRQILLIFTVKDIQVKKCVFLGDNEP